MRSRPGRSAGATVASPHVPGSETLRSPAGAAGIGCEQMRNDGLTADGEHCDAAILPHLPRQTACRGVLQAFVDSYDGATHRLLTDLADVIGASIAYVDRPTVEAHVERPLSAWEWDAATQQFTAMAFDDHVGDAGSLRTDWIEDVLARAGVPGRGHTGPPVAGAPLGGA